MLWQDRATARLMPSAHAVRVALRSCCICTRTLPRAARQEMVLMEGQYVVRRFLTGWL